MEYGIHMRAGCMCNPGACLLSVTQGEDGAPRDEAVALLKKRGSCDDMSDFVWRPGDVQGYPVGVLRVSLGAYTNKQVPALLASASALYRNIESFSLPEMRRWPSGCRHVFGFHSWHILLKRSGRTSGQKEATSHGPFFLRCFCNPVPNSRLQRQKERFRKRHEHLLNAGLCQ